jgi:hypothetical protein
MKFDKKTILSALITICLLLLITILIRFCIIELQNTKQEGLQYYGDEIKTLDAPLGYKTVMEYIKYPTTNEESGESPIYDNGNKIYNSILFNKEDKRMHFSDQSIMKDLKHFNNASNLLLEHYLNNNVPDKVTTKIPDASIANSFVTESITKNAPSYLYDTVSLGRNISKTKTYLHRKGENNNQIRVKDGICLDAYDRNKVGRTIHMINCENENKNQQWSYTPSIKQIKVTDGLCLDAPLEGGAGKVHLTNCNIDNTNQHWNYEQSTMQIKSIGGYCLHASDTDKERAEVVMKTCHDNSYNQQWVISGDPGANNGLYLFSDIVDVNGVQEEDKIYNYDYDLSGISYNDVYTQLTKYNDSSFNSEVSMTKSGKYSSHYFESNYSDLSDNVTKDFKYFYSTAPTIAGRKFNQ